MNRRGFLKGLVGAGAALILPQEPEKRFFQLDRTMLNVPFDGFANHETFERLRMDMSYEGLDKRFTHVSVIDGSVVYIAETDPIKALLRRMDHDMATLRDIGW